MDTYLQTFLGIGVSVALFLVGYRRTIGARKERVRTANVSVHRALLKRMVLEEYQPRVNDVVRLLEGKAREYQVRVSEMRPEREVLNHLFAEIFDNDLIPPNHRRNLEQRLSPLLDEFEETPPHTRIVLLQDQLTVRRKRFLVSTMIFSTSVVGVISAILPNLIRGERFVLSFIQLGLPVWVGSIAAMVVLQSLRRVADPSDEISASDAAQESLKLEREVVAVLDAVGVAFHTQVPAAKMRADFLIEVRGRKIVLDIFTFRGFPPAVVGAASVHRMKTFVREIGADEGVILVRDESRFPRGISVPNNIHIMSVHGLKEYLHQCDYREK